MILAVLVFARSLLAQESGESGDGFSESDRGMLRDVRAIASGNSTDLGIIKLAVISTRDTVDQIETDIESIESALETIATRQSAFNSVQQNMLNTLLNWESSGVPGTEDLPLIQQNTYNAATHLSYIRSDLSDVSDNTTQMNGHLLNIDRETTESSDYLHSIDLTVQYLASLVERISTNSASTVDITAISNALVKLNVAADMSMVTNFAILASYPSFVAQWWPLNDSFSDFVASFFGPADELNYGELEASSIFGFLRYMMITALLPNPSAIYRLADGGLGNIFSLAYNVWGQDSQYGSLSAGVDWPYTIFDAYNTLGLGVLTNQSNILIGQGVYVTNSLAIIVSNLVASLSVAEKTRDALYYPEDSETIYETTNHYSVPEWEPTYHTGIAENTNYYYYFQQADSFTRSLIGNYTSLLGRVIGGIKPQHRDWDAKITWSGWPSMQGQYGGWDLDVRLPDTPDVVDFAKYVKFLSRLVCFVLDLCIVLLGATRIHKTVMGGQLPFES